MEIESQKETQLKRAPTIESVKQVVKIALRRVRRGNIDSLGAQAIGLYNSESKRIYMIEDVRAVTNPSLKREIALQGDIGGGLFVRGVQLDNQGWPIDKVIDIQIPRKVNLVRQDNIRHLGEIEPTVMEELAKDLASHSIERAPIDFYWNAVLILRAKELRAQVRPMT